MKQLLLHMIEYLIMLLLTQYTCPEIISWDPISLGFLVYIDAVWRQ